MVVDRDELSALREVWCHILGDQMLQGIFFFGVPINLNISPTSIEFRGDLALFFLIFEWGSHLKFS